MPRKSDNESPGSFEQQTQSLLDAFRSRRPIRTGSLLISVFGDAIAPHGGTVWLGSLIEALEPFGINQRLVRTSVFRLAKDGWLTSEQIGRRSYYSLSDMGRRRFSEASRRIYMEPRQPWPGTWCLALLSGAETAQRDELRKELGWLGFAPFSTNLLAHPSPDLQEVDDHIANLPGSDTVLIMEARVHDNRNAYLRELVHRTWQLEELRQRYVQFLDQFRPIYQAARRTRSPSPVLAFQVRTLLIHEYRRILLRDPMLPEALLPGRWDGIAAYQLCRNLYSAISPAAERYLVDHMESADGPLPPAEPKFYQRFGGHGPSQA